MTRHFHYTISLEEAGTSIYVFLQKRGFSRQNIVELKKIPESILVNNVWSYVNVILKKGDLLDIHVIENKASEKIIPIDLPLSILYEDEDLLIINKAANMPIHPSFRHYEGTVANAVAFYYASQNIPYVFRCINRLDRNTTGLTMLAKNMVSGGILSTMAAQRIITREYYAIVDNADYSLTEGMEQTITAPIARCGESIITREVNFEHGERAVTHFKVLSCIHNYALLSLKLETGRTHQIRVHMSHINHPLLGDSLYGGCTTQIKRQALHSRRLSFAHPITKENLSFCAALPDDMQSLIPFTM